MLHFNSTMSDYKKILAKAAASSKTPEEEIKANGDCN